VDFRQDGDTYIKRVYALPGEQLELLHYNDETGNELLDPSEAAGLRRLQAAGLLAGGRVLTLTVPTDHGFVLGDNNSHLIDSRLFGPVPVSAFLGRIVR
jgi:signal peptidase I